MYGASESGHVGNTNRVVADMDRQSSEVVQVVADAARQRDGANLVSG